MVIENNWSSFTIRYGYVYFKKVDYQMTEEDLVYVEGCEMWIYDPTVEEKETNDVTEENTEDENGGAWVQYFDLDLYGKGDVETVMAADYSLEELKQMVIDNNWSSFTLRYGYVYFKKVDYQMTEEDLVYVEGCEMWIYDPTVKENEPNVVIDENGGTWVQYFDKYPWAEGQTNIPTDIAAHYSLDELKQKVIDKQWYAFSLNYGFVFFTEVES